MIEKINNLIMYNVFNIPFAVLFICLSGIYLLFSLKFINFRKCKEKEIKTQDGHGISKLQAFASASAGTLGIGNIFGGAMAVTMAGAGAIFWICVFGVIASIIKFCEVYLGHRFREINGKIISGGSFLYIQNAIKSKFSKQFAIIYSIVFIIAYVGAGTFQVNQIASMAKVSFETLSPEIVKNLNIIISIPIALFTCIFLFGGIKKIAIALTTMIPLMAVFYFIAVFIVCFEYCNNIIPVFERILSQAFEPSVPLGFVLGYSLHRILFATDAGTGVSAIANAQANSTPYKQAKLVAFEPILVALAMCFTGFAVLLTNSDALAISNGLSGVQIAHFAFNFNFFTEIVFFLVVILFGVSTTLAHGYNVEQAVLYISKGRFSKICKILYSAAIIFVANMSLDRIIPIIDLSVFLSIFVNLIAILFCVKLIKKETKI